MFWLLALYQTDALLKYTVLSLTVIVLSLTVIVSRFKSYKLTFLCVFISMISTAGVVNKHSLDLGGGPDGVVS